MTSHSNELHEWLQTLDLEDLPHDLSICIGVGDDGQPCYARVPNVRKHVEQHRRELDRGVSPRLKSGTFDAHLVRLRAALDDDDPFAF